MKESFFLGPDDHVFKDSRPDIFRGDMRLIEQVAGVDQHRWLAVQDQVYFASRVGLADVPEVDLAQGRLPFVELHLGLPLQHLFPLLGLRDPLPLVGADCQFDLEDVA